MCIFNRKHAKVRYDEFLHVMIFHLVHIIREFLSKYGNVQTQFALAVPITKICPCNIQKVFMLKKKKKKKITRIFFIFFFFFSNEYSQSMIWSKSKKNRYTTAYFSFCICRWGIRGYTLHGNVIVMP